MKLDWGVEVTSGGDQGILFLYVVEGRCTTRKGGRGNMAQNQRTTNQDTEGPPESLAIFKSCVVVVMRGGGAV